MKYDIFISYSSKDIQTANDICRMLEENDVSCWMSPRNVTGGRPYAREIIEAINDSQVMLFIFSDNSNQSDHVENEIDYAFSQNKTIIPFKISDTKMNPELIYYLNRKHWVDGTPNPQEKFDLLLNTIQKNLPEKEKELQKQQLLAMLRQTEIDDDFKKELMEALLNEQAKKKQGQHESSRYDLLQNGEGNLLLIINAKDGEPENPRIVYDGGEQALLYRNRSSALTLRDLKEGAREPLVKAKEITVAEILDDDVEREYKVPVRIVKKLQTLIE